MDFLFWDASALSKRYSPEIGSETVDALFQEKRVRSHLAILWTYAETYALLSRKRNDKRLKDEAFNTAVISLEEEVLFGPSFRSLPISDQDVLFGLTPIKRHHLNSTDAILLSVLLHTVQRQGHDIVLVTADKRLARAAAAEGLRVINPEEVTAEEVSALLPVH